MSNVQAKRSTSTETRLLEAAIDAVARHGYVDTTVANIIASAGASRSTFYELFPGKDECVLAAASAIVERLKSLVQERTADGEPLQIPAQIAEALLEFALAESTQARVIFTELLAGGAAAMDLRDDLIDSLAAVLQRAWRRDGDSLAAIDMPAQALIGGIFRLLSFRMRRDGRGLHELQSSVLHWMGAYALDGGTPAWHSPAALQKLRVPPRKRVGLAATPTQLPRGRHGLLASEITKNHHDRLLHATAACVADKGYAATTVTDIVRAARVSRGAFYSNFTDKEAVALATMQHTFETSMSACVGAFFAEPLTPPNWPDRLWEAARALSDYYAQAPALVLLAFVEGYAVSIQLVEERVRAFTLLLELGFQYRAEAQGLDRSISEIVAGATFELAYREIRRRRPGQFSALLPQLAYLNLAPFMGAEQATCFVRERVAELKAH